MGFGRAAAPVFAAVLLTLAGEQSKDASTIRLNDA